MPLVPTRDLMRDAQRSGTGLAAFNVITLEHAEAVVSGAEASSRPLIVQLSENAVGFHGGDVFTMAAAISSLAQASSARLAMHLDHVESFPLLHDSAAAGFSSVMFDASRLDYADNVRATARATQWAHANGLYLEAELGAVGGKGGAHRPGTRTDPAEARRFVTDTGVDALAVAVGSSHAMVERSAALDHHLIARLGRAVPVPLVLHGSSGVPDDELRTAVAAGIVKVNFGTILNVAYTGAVRTALLADPHVVDPREYLAPARGAVATTVARLAGVITTR